MRSPRWSAFTGWLIVASLATGGFAAFSPRPAAAPPTTTQPPASHVGDDAGRVMAMAFLSAGYDLAPSAPAVPTSIPPDPRGDRPISPTAPTPTSTSTTTSGPTTTTTTVVTHEHSPVSWPSGSTCLASWYGPGFDGRTTASGEIFDSEALTGAVHEVAFNTMVTVTRIETGDSVIVRINDRGPYVWRGAWFRHPARCIDLSAAAMRALGGIDIGVLPVTIEY